MHWLAITPPSCIARRLSSLLCWGADYNDRKSIGIICSLPSVAVHFAASLKLGRRSADCCSIISPGRSKRSDRTQPATPSP
eukprot:1143400-Pelagomonas_calceolata.AAC.10